MGPSLRPSSRRCQRSRWTPARWTICGGHEPFLIPSKKNPAEAGSETAIDRPIEVIVFARIESVGFPPGERWRGAPPLKAATAGQETTERPAYSWAQTPGASGTPLG